MGLTRRGFLGIGAAGSALLLVGGAGVALQPTPLRASTIPLQALSPRQFSVLVAFADRVCPGDDTFPSASDVHVAEKVDALLASNHPGMAKEFGQALLLFDNALAGLLLDGRWRTFSAASAEVQDAAITAWRTSRFATRRQVYKALRGLVSASYYASPETYAAVGYPGPPDFSGVNVAPEPVEANTTEEVP